MNSKVVLSINTRMTSAEIHRAIYKSFEGSPHLYAQTEKKYEDTISIKSGRYSMDHLDSSFSLPFEVWTQGIWSIVKRPVSLSPPDESEHLEKDGENTGDDGNRNESDEAQSMSSAPKDTDGEITNEDSESESSSRSEGSSYDGHE